MEDKYVVPDTITDEFVKRAGLNTREVYVVDTWEGGVKVKTEETGDKLYFLFLGSRNFENKKIEDVVENWIKIIKN